MMIRSLNDRGYLPVPTHGTKTSVSPVSLTQKTSGRENTVESILFVTHVQDECDGQAQHFHLLSDEFHLQQRATTAYLENDFIPTGDLLVRLDIYA